MATKVYYVRFESSLAEGYFHVGVYSTIENAQAACDLEERQFSKPPIVWDVLASPYVAFVDGGRYIITPFLLDNPGAKGA